MTGGKAYIWDPAMGLKGRLAETAPSARRIEDDELEEVRTLVESHVEHTGSPLGREALQLLREMWVVDPETSGGVVVLEESESTTP